MVEAWGSGSVGEIFPDDCRLFGQGPFVSMIKNARPAKSSQAGILMSFYSLAWVNGDGRSVFGIGLVDDSGCVEWVFLA